MCVHDAGTAWRTETSARKCNLQWRLDHKRSISNPTPTSGPRAEVVAPQGLETQVTSPSCHFWEVAWLVRRKFMPERVVGTRPE